MRRLYQNIYLVFLASLVAPLVLSGVVWRIVQANANTSEALALASELAGAVLPPPDAPPQVLQQALERLGRSGIDIALFDKNRALLGKAGKPLPQPTSVGERGGPA